MRHHWDPAKPPPWPVNPLRVPEDRRGLWQGLVLGYPFWDTGQRRVEDVSGRGLHGAWGASLTEADWKVLEQGPALDFTSNVGKYLQVDDPPGDPLDGFSAFSAEVWFVADDFSVQRGLIGKYRPDNGYRAWRFYYNGVLTLQVSSDGTAFESQAATAGLSTGTLYQALFTYNAGAFTLYVNGASVAVTGNFSSQTSIFAGAAPFLVGQRRTTLDFAADVFDGRILSVRVWDRALRADEALELWEDPWGMYRPDWALPLPVAEHSGGAAAGPWELVDEVDAGVEELLIPGLQNGISYDVVAKTVDLSENVSDGCTPESGTPAASTPVAVAARGVLSGGLVPPASVWRLR